MLMKLVTLIVVCVPISLYSADVQTYRDRNGTYIGKSVTGSKRTTFYDKSGSYVGRYQSGRVSTLYDRSGRVVGRGYTVRGIGTKRLP